MMNPTAHRAIMAGIAISLCSCVSAPWLPSPGNQVVYALGGRAQFESPLGGNLKPACPALEFPKGSLIAGPQHDQVLKDVAKTSAGENKQRFVVAGYCRPGLPPEYARVLAEKRAHSVRQKLIELGVDPEAIQTAGFGNDFALTGPASDVVVIYGPL